jgi:CHAD domain-containing protein
MREVKNLWDILGEVRDWDVFATATWPAITAGRELAERASIDAGITKARDAARRKLESALAGPRFQQAVLAMLWSLEHQRAEAKAQEQHEARAFARKALKKRQKRVRGYDGVLDLPPEQRHRLRIDAKKLRYTAEFFGELFPGRETRRFTARLADLQTDLGELNDLAMTPARLDAVVSGISAGSAQAARELWSEHERSRMAALERSVARTWKRFDKAARFWR